MEELGTLRWFLEAARNHSFSATARHFGVTPAAVSQGIARLENELGTRLFNRTTRRLSLTAEGRLYYETAKSALARLDEAALALKGMRAEPRGTIKVLTTGSFGKQELLPILPEFLDIYPGVDVELSLRDGRIDLISDGYDLAIRRRAFRDSYSITRHLCNLSLALVASPGYLARKGIPREPADLKGHEWIAIKTPPGGSGSYLLQPEVENEAEKGARPSSASRIDGAHFRIQVAASKTAASTDDAERIIAQRPSRLTISDQLDATLQAAVAGIGIGLISLHLTRVHLESGQLKVLLPEYRIIGDTEVFIQYPNREYLPPKTRVLIDFLVKKLSRRFDVESDHAVRRQYAAHAA